MEYREERVCAVAQRVVQLPERVLPGGRQAGGGAGYGLERASSGGRWGGGVYHFGGSGGRRGKGGRRLCGTFAGGPGLCGTTFRGGEGLRGAGGVRDFSRSALVIAGHGSTVNPDSSAPTLEHARAIRKRGIFAEVVCCFWKEEPGYREVLRMVDSEEVFVVPNFISEGYFTQTVVPREMGLDGPVTQIGGRTVRYCEPVGNHPAMTELLLARAGEVAAGVPTRETALLIVGHGTGLNENSAVAAKEQVRRISELERYGEVIAAYMEEPPLIAEWDKISSMPNVVVVPFFISDGLHSYQDIPVLLGIEEEGELPASQRAESRRVRHELRGRQLFYSMAIGTDPGFANVIIDQARRAAG
ncbi:MAG: cobalamin biosynthesis protein CbiX [Verrucomicrobia bacterium]|nr:cobalamin biosynthesis protein CbiX [Verrucomicrobiota bacterium]